MNSGHQRKISSDALLIFQPTLPRQCVVHALPPEEICKRRHLGLIFAEADVQQGCLGPVLLTWMVVRHSTCQDVFQR